jgi:class 3 adenylate cyclase
VRCAGCKQENREGRKFCAACGSPLAMACGRCGAPNEPGEKFCGECGATLGAVGSHPTTNTVSPRSYTPKHLADKILQSKSALEGERKQVTVLFADVKGSMELAEQLDPEAWSEIMQRFFRILAEGVERFEGFVDKFTGDGIMALFGAPIAHEDHAQRACYAALHLRDAARTYEGRALSPRILEMRGRLAAALADAPASDRALQQALDLYRAISATGHAEQLARELGA